MSFLVVGKGMFTEDALVKKLEQWGIKNPLAVVKDAAKGRAICGMSNEITIMLFR
jgi:hypothetical protein